MIARRKANLDVGFTISDHVALNEYINAAVDQHAVMGITAAASQILDMDITVEYVDPCGTLDVDTPAICVAVVGAAWPDLRILYSDIGRLGDCHAISRR